MALQVISKRRSRFRRATSGSQNLTMLIYNILKEQIASKKSAILSAFDANMSAKNYDSTYGGVAVNRQAVEAFYAEMIAAFPPGTTEHDKMVAELNKFHSDAIYAEMKAYRDAYESGTFAFGKKVELTDYLSFLRDAKASTNNEADYQEYNVEEFIVTFNDVNTDMKAKGASAGSMAKFYRRELSRAEEMGITKDSEAYRRIQIYLKDAEKQAAVDYKNNLYKDAVDNINKQAGKISEGLIGAMKAAVDRGYLTYSDMIQITGNDVVATFKNYMSLDQGMQAKILAAGIDAGIKVGDKDFNSSFIYDIVTAMRDSLKNAAESNVGGAQVQAQMLQLLNMVDDNFTEPLGMLTGLEKADKASTQFRVDQEHVFGNPLSKADLYARHAATLDKLGVTGVSGKAVQDIFRGLVPEGGKDFKNEDGTSKKFLYELNGEEVNRLIQDYTGLVYVFMPGVDPKAVIADAVQEYRSKNDVETGKAFLEWRISPDSVNSPNPVVEVAAVPSPVTGGIPTVSGPKLTDDSEISIVGSQQKVPVYAQDGQTVIGHKFFEIGDNGAPVFKFLTLDQKVMDFDAFERYASDLGASVGAGPNGSVIVGTTTGSPFTGASIGADPVFADYVSKDNFIGVAKGPGFDRAVKAIGEDVAKNVVGTRGSSNAFSVDQATGAISVVNSEVARAISGLDKSQLDAILNMPGNEYQSLDPSQPIRVMPNPAQQAVGVALFKASERDYYAATAGQALPQDQLNELRTKGAEAAASYQSKITARERADILSRSPVLNNPFSQLGFIPGSNQLGLSEKDARRLSELQGGVEKYSASAEKYKTESRISKLGGVMSMSPTVSPSIPSSASKPSGASDYFFRYSQITSPENAPTAVSQTGNLYGGTSLSSGATYSAPAPIKFTPEQINQSLIDFRAGERVS